jgi:hypothetical protein
MTHPTEPPMTRTLNQHGRRLAAELTEVRKLAEGDPLGPNMVRRTTAHQGLEKLAGVIEGVLLYGLPIWEAPATAPAAAPDGESDDVVSLDTTLLRTLQNQLHVAIVGQANAGWAEVPEGEDPESHAVSRAQAAEGAGDAIAHEIDALFAGEGPVKAIARRLAFYRRRIEELEGELAARRTVDGTLV